MKKTIALMAAFLIGSAAVLQAQAFQKGTNVLSAGIGIGSSLGYTSNSQTPALSMNFERGTWEVGPGVISIGGYAGYKTFKYSGSSGGYSFSQTWTYSIIGVRGAFHYTQLKNDKIDVYGGVMLSYNFLKYKYKDNYSGGSGTVYASGNYGSTAGFTAYVGGRYFLAKTFAAYVELGYGVSYVNAGLSLKF